MSGEDPKPLEPGDDGTDSDASAIRTGTAREHDAAEAKTGANLASSDPPSSEQDPRGASDPGADEASETATEGGDGDRGARGATDHEAPHRASESEPRGPQHEADALEASQHEEPSKGDTKKPARLKETLPLDQTAVMEAAATHPWGAAARAITLATLLGIALVAWAQFTFESRWVPLFVMKNQLEVGRRMTLIVSMLLGGALGAGTSGGLLYWFKKKGIPFSELERWTWFLAPLTLAPTFPLLFRHRAWEDRHEELLPGLLFVGLTMELFVFRALVAAPAQGRRVYNAMREEIPQLVRRHGPVIIVVASAVAYAAFMSFFMIRWHHRLGTGTYDLGINNNLMYGGLHGDFNQSAVVFPFEPQKYIANHIKIGVYVFLPIYALVPRPETLQVLQSTLIGMSAIPLFLFSRRRVTEWTAAIIAVSYLSYYPLHGATFYEVKMVPMASFFILMAAWAADAKRWFLLGLSFVIGMLMREDMPVGFAIMGGFLLLSGHRPKAGLLMAAVASSWFVFLRFYVMDTAGEWWFPKMYKDLWADGETGFRSVIKTLVSNPFFTLTHVIIEKKVEYLMHLLVPIMFLPARRWYLWAAFLPGAILTLLVTDYKPVTMYSFQYVMHWAPYMFLAIPLALVAYQQSGPSGHLRARAALAAMVFSVAVLCYNYGAFTMRDGALKSGYHKITFSVDAEDKARYAALMDIISSIPPDASVATSEKIGPHLSSRRHFFSLRRGSYHVDYIVVQKKGLRLDRTKKVVTEALTSGEYGVFRTVGDFVLLKRKHSTAKNDALIDEWRLSRPRRGDVEPDSARGGQFEEDAMPDEPDLDQPDDERKPNGTIRRPAAPETE